MVTRVTSIRNAKVSDRQIVKNLVNKVYRECEGQIWIKSHERLTDKSFESYCSKQELKLAELGDVIVGCVVASETPCDAMELSMLVVHPDYRNKGIGRELVDFVIDVAKTNESHCVKIGLLYPKHHADPWKMSMRSWYTRLGFIFVKDVDIVSFFPEFANDLSIEVQFSWFEKVL